MCPIRIPLANQPIPIIKKLLHIPQSNNFSLDLTFVSKLYVARKYYSSNFLFKIFLESFHKCIFIFSYYPHKNWGKCEEILHIPLGKLFPYIHVLVVSSLDLQTPVYNI